MTRRIVILTVLAVTMLRWSRPPGAASSQQIIIHVPRYRNPRPMMGKRWERKYG